MKRFLKYFFIVSILLMSMSIGALWYVFNYYEVDFAPLAHYDPGHPSILLDDEGKEWARFQLDKREPVSLSKMQDHVINAFIAAEDWRFFNHSGISIKGIARSTLINMLHARIVQGASTITQQLVKLLFFDAQRTFTRKIKEQVFALLVEQQFSKDQILETYLNHVYFGCGIYGVEAASQRFWGKSADALTIAESATLAAIVRSPGQYCPLLYPLSAKRRRNIILHSMKKLHFIDQESYDAAIATDMIIKPADQTVCAPHLKEALRYQLEDLFGKQTLYAGGLKIQTTLNKSMQAAAQDGFHQHMAELKKTITPEIDGGLITIEVKTSEIKALIGGFDFYQSKFNRALQAKRQMGSIFKPIVYAQAMRMGMSFADTEIDEPLSFEQHGVVWQPQNYNEKFDGQMTLASALFHSNNIIAIKTLLKIGIEPVVALAQQCRLTGAMYPYPSLALGCIDATLKEAVGMFNIFANGGIYRAPHAIRWVKDRWGSKIWKGVPEQERILSSGVSGKVAKVLQLGMNRLRIMLDKPLLDCDAICKTGTTNESRTCWFAGSTPDYTTVVYVGCDDNRPMGKNIYPIKTAFPIWLSVQNALPQLHKKFIYDPSLHMITINRWTGQRVSADDPEAIEIAV